jgi:hypothetical protein
MQKRGWQPNAGENNHSLANRSKARPDAGKSVNGYAAFHAVADIAEDAAWRSLLLMNPKPADAVGQQSGGNALSLPAHKCLPVELNPNGLCARQIAQDGMPLDSLAAHRDTPHSWKVIGLTGA